VKYEAPWGHSPGGNGPAKDTQQGLGQAGTIVAPDADSAAAAEAPAEPDPAAGLRADKAKAILIQAEVLDYVTRGWQPVKLHGLTSAGWCTCRDSECDRNRGKHPVAGAWQRAEPLSVEEAKQEYA